MAKVKLEGFIDAFKTVADGLEAARDATRTPLTDALKKWGSDTARDARQKLARPHWELSRSITSKFKEYGNGAKLWAMAGFKFDEKNNKRSPGYYGQFHEAGWRPGGYKPSAPDHFLKDAKKANIKTLEHAVKEAGEAIAEAIRQKIKEKQIEIKNKRERGF